MLAWLEFERVTLADGRRATVTEFCKLKKIARRTFYCARQRWLATAPSDEACKLADWG